MEPLIENLDVALQTVKLSLLFHDVAVQLKTLDEEKWLHDSSSFLVQKVFCSVCNNFDVSY